MAKNPYESGDTCDEKNVRAGCLGDIPEKQPTYSVGGKRQPAQNSYVGSTDDTGEERTSGGVENRQLNSHVHLGAQLSSCEIHARGHTLDGKRRAGLERITQEKFLGVQDRKNGGIGSSCWKRVVPLGCRRHRRWRGNTAVERGKKVKIVVLTSKKESIKRRLP